MFFFQYLCVDVRNEAEHRRINAIKLWCLRVPWTARKSNQSILKEINLEYSLQWTDAEVEAPILWPPDGKSRLIGKDPDARIIEDWRQKEKVAVEDEMVKQHHWFSGHELEQTPGNREGQGILVCCSSWHCRVGHHWRTEQQPFTWGGRWRNAMQGRGSLSKDLKIVDSACSHEINRCFGAVTAMIWRGSWAIMWEHESAGKRRADCEPSGSSCLSELLPKGSRLRPSLCFAIKSLLWWFWSPRI